MNSTSGRKVVIGVVLLVIVVAATVLAMRPKHGSGGAGGTPEVAVAVVEQKDVPIYGEWIGTLEGFVNADVRGQVTGYLVRQDYKEGACQDGQLLFEIDPGLSRPRSMKRRDNWRRRSHWRTRKRAKADATRRGTLHAAREEQAASQQDLDNAVQNNLAALATVATARAQIKTAEAAVETAQMNSDSLA